MKNFERTLPPQLSQEILYKDDQLDIGIKKLERAYSFNQALENYTNYDQGNDNVREINPTIFGNSQEISRIDGDHGSFQDLCDQVTDPLSSIKRQTLFENESVPESNLKVQSKIRSTVSDFHIYQTDLSELIKGFIGNLQSFSILIFSQCLLSAVLFIYRKSQNQTSFGTQIQVPLESQKHFINEIQSNHNIQNKTNDTAEFKTFFLQSKNAGMSLKSKSNCFKEINQGIQNYVYDIKSQTLKLKQKEPSPSKIPFIDPIIDQQKKRLLEEQKQKEGKKNQQQEQHINQKLIEQQFNLDFTKLYQQVNDAIIHQYNSNVQSPFTIQNQNFSTIPNMFQNFTNYNPLSNIPHNNQQQAPISTNFNTMSNSYPAIKNYSDQNKSKQYNTRSGRS
ncbi:unnamed protein product (macronuclear) [Paramecium tetraurelia]|uniref:Transmembrane protein n=1 Tax=Paramecium tetraurelia TaxID=5888 RepID=A0D115_PARTE|nr:uncharacterized protein GSPATT00012284001 [Paramecium tetraurelia]CAK76732.1 unnamed protein product [Paramecium tetraurelia]|eukprot:XP_001444129.1 hypothetical protein (macronuclear) [Paramecium tetraurelia strain d4-2]